MKPSRDSIGTLIIVIGTGVFVSGFYYLGYHHGLEFMRKGDSGLGGLGELMTAWVQIFGGVGIVLFGVIVRSRRE